jgi:DNA-directed RNA polymerase subunit RPC12/RpoP
MREYECPSCFYIFERYGGGEGDEEEVSCPRCGARGAIESPPSPFSAFSAKGQRKEMKEGGGCRICFG